LVAHYLNVKVNNRARSILLGINQMGYLEYEISRFISSSYKRSARIPFVGLDHSVQKLAGSAARF
jgi:hypothetical protein